MKRRETINLVLHIVVGLLLTLAALWNSWMLIPDTFIYMWLREQAQHRGKRDIHGDFEDNEATFFGWMTWHRIFEVFQWVIGATLACIGWHFFGPS